MFHAGVASRQGVRRDIITTTFMEFISDWRTVIGIILFVIVILFLLRDLRLWYWKINEVVTLLERIDSTLTKMNARQLELQFKGYRNSPRSIKHTPPGGENESSN